LSVLPKKRFGQHFLKDKNIAQRICGSLSGQGYTQVFEVGPGLGVLTQFLYPLYERQLYLVEIDTDLIPGLESNYPQIRDHIFQEDFLKLRLDVIFKEPYAIIGNFPYNISSQILFKLVENKALVPEMVGMFQREVAQRVAAPPGNKIYGLLSAWLQCFYETEYLFTVNEGAFNPPPKVKSAVIRLKRKKLDYPGLNEKLLLSIIKQAFGQRRKTLRNSLSAFRAHFTNIPEEVLNKRAEQLSHSDFIELAYAFSKADAAIPEDDLTPDELG
jgi:16S rRNA (adenine1518-N6/adenine1519-N6)-dimethyltransferase